MKPKSWTFPNSALSLERLITAVLELNNDPNSVSIKVLSVLFNGLQIKAKVHVTPNEIKESCASLLIQN